MSISAGLSFIRESDNALRIYLLIRDKNGSVREEKFLMRRYAGWGFDQTEAFFAQLLV